ncbi:hypothetical protein VE04_09900, partial [Pseudogymnoascus sp. 24MN13]
MGRHRSGDGSSYRPDKRKTRDWDDPDGPGDAAERSPRVLYERFDPENISRLWRLYDTQWHHKPGERFLTRNEFTDLLEEMHTTKITEIHDEGMRRIKEDSAPSLIRAACAARTRRRRSPVTPRTSKQPKRSYGSTSSSSPEKSPISPPLSVCASGEGGEVAAATKGGPGGMTESALMSAFAGLMRWEEGAEKAR